ncbi:MAG: amidase [Gemmataceae bacterium]|nr:amidase [Gemmataceae bacterium]
MVVVASLSVAAEQQRRGELSAVELVEQCLQRWQAVEEKLQAWTFVDADGARLQAQLRAQEGERGEWRGPLHGIVVGIKDIIDVFDWPTGCGSARWANSYARQDAPIIRRLRQAGAVLLGKTVTTPYAYLDPAATRNPWHQDRTPGGSSSGSAVAVAAGMVPLALGTQTGGSIIRPAAYCGICGFKPTYGRLPKGGILPLAPSLDHVGLLAATVADLQTAFIALRPRPAWCRISALTVPELRLLAIPEFLDDARFTADVHQHYHAWRQRTLALGRQWSEVSLPVPLSELRRYHGTILAVEAAAFHGPRWQRYPDDYPPQISRLIREGLRMPALEYHQAKRHLRSVRRCIDDWFARAGGILALPATFSPPPPPDTTGDPACQSPWSYLGLPVVSFPIAWNADGLPLAVQLVGPRNSDELLLTLAIQLTKAVPWEQRPLPI